MNVWRSTDPNIYNMQWTDDGAWWDRKSADAVANDVHTHYETIRRVAVIRIKSIKEK